MQYRLDDAIRAWRVTTRERINATANALINAGADDKGVIEALELLRYEAHRELDDLIDDEQTRRPPGGNCWRARRYREIAVPHDV